MYTFILEIRPAEFAKQSTYLIYQHYVYLINTTRESCDIQTNRILLSDDKAAV